MQNEFKPTEKMLELKRDLLLMPKSERRARLDKAMEIVHQRQKVAELKAEREALLKKLYQKQDNQDLVLGDNSRPPACGTWSPPASYLVNTPPSPNPAKREK